MKRVLLAAGVMCAVAVTGRTTAQNSSPTGLTMPGQVVGSYTGMVNPVGNRLPAAAPQVGSPVTANALQRPYDPNHPYDAFKGTDIDPKNVVAPLVTPDGKTIIPPDSLDRLSEKIKAFFVRTPSPPPRPAYTPGITRRARERHQMLWRRD